jgi:gliding motility-associated-like protein
MKIKFICTLFIALILFSFVRAQLIVTPSNNGAALVNQIVGTGVTVSGITMNCPNNAAGTFTGGAGNLQIPNGIVMTTGLASSVAGPASNNASTDHWASGHALISGSQDACALTFTIVPTCNVLSIQFVFGSEEYPNWVGSSFNDAFGFFVSGPNPGGGSYTNHNMALIPGTSTPISINNVNANTNSTYFINNTGGTLVTYNGLTTSITATVNVVPCASYTMTIVIADRGDGSLDSGVFLQSGGLNCSDNPVLTISPNTVICSGESVTLTANGGTGHVWSPVTGLNTTTGTTVIASPTTTTTYTVTANVPCPATAQTTVTVVDAVNLTANLCVGQTFDASIPLPTGGTITEVGGDRIHRFNAVGTSNFVVPNGFSGSIQYLIVAGGGGGGGPDTGGTNRTSGGGGAGGVRSGTTQVGSGTLPVVVGGGGAAGTTAGDRRGANGGNSSFNGIVSLGGGGGGASNFNGGNRQGQNGGSGGGAGQEGTTHAGQGTAGQGNNGGVANTSDGGGGGGAGAAGQSAAAGSQGGAGISSNITGVAAWYGGGGAGSRQSGGAIAGGTGGGGNSAHTAAATNGVANTGGGGGAGVRRSSTNYVAGSGGSGTVILRYSRPIYVSSNPAVATVDANGIVTAVSNGTANISISNNDMCYDVVINVNNSALPTFNQAGPYCQGTTIPALPTTSNNGITGTWSPALNNSATTTYTFTPNPGQCATTTTMTVEITPSVTPTFNAVGPYCQGAVIPALPTTSTNGISGSWSPALNNMATTTYTFTPNAGQCALTQTMVITINPLVTPTFNAAGPFCTGDVIPALPTTSTNGITGSWSPALNNNATTTYTFTPTAGQCAANQTLTIAINPLTTPTFNAVAPYCQGAVIPALPTTSTNGIAGNWSPALNNNATTTYTFTPNAGQCASTTTMTVNITPNVTPAFNPVGPFCSGATIPALPTTSTNGITGTWSPVINNTTTTTYTFTPTAGQCALTATMTIAVESEFTPTFNTVGPFCQGDIIPALPTTSTNGIIGTWSPALNNNTTTTYTFTPNAGQCALDATLTITINALITPTFNAAGPFCQGTTIAALPTTSTNGITGSWSPAINNTATTTYTFTPNSGQCATISTMTININPQVTPTFNQVGPFCSGATIAALPTSSTNGITGTWSPAINNNATTTYTFTPSAGQCATIATLTITINPQITPTFNQVGPFCSGETIAALPTTSTNGITGTWSPAINNNATATYTFTPYAGQCAVNQTMTITINALITPSFNTVGPICQGSTFPALPTTSNNGITGSWSPALNNNTTTTYTFTPSSGQCAVSSSMTIQITPTVTPTFNALGSYCQGTTIPALPTTSTNGITGVWSPAMNNNATTTYTFTPSAGQCATTATQTIVITPLITPTFNSVGPFCAGVAIPILPTNSINGIVGTWSPAINNNITTTYTFTPTAGQCALTTTLTIAINSASQSNSSVQLCANQTPYNWNGMTLNNTGIYTATLVNANGCDSIATLNLTVNPLPEVSFTADIEDGCAPVRVTFSSENVNPNSTCLWNLGNGVQVNNCGTFTTSYSTFGCHDVTLQVTSEHGCVSSSTQTNLVCVNPGPTAAFAVNPQIISNISPTVHFFNHSQNHTSSTWIFGDGSGNSTNENPVHSYSTEAGYYYATLVVTDEQGCTDTTHQLIVVENELIYYVPNTFTPDFDQFNQTFRPIFTEGLDIFNYNLLIFNRWGEILFESNDVQVGWDGTYGGEICQDGTYIWQITFKELGRDKRNLIRGHVNLLR